MKKLEITIEEAIATLSRSSLPSVLAEGLDDHIVLRRIEERCSDIGFSIFPVGGRDKAIKIWEGLPEERRKQTLVVVDKDMWLFEGTPAQYRVEQFVESVGFSIENDLRADWDWEILMLEEERKKFKEELRKVCRWFSDRVARKLYGQEISIADHPNKILEEESWPDDDPMDVEKNYVTRLRGKTLINLALRQLGCSGRMPRHTARSLMEMAATFHGQHMNRYEQKMRDFFSPPPS